MQYFVGCFCSGSSTFFHETNTKLPPFFSFFSQGDHKKPRAKLLKSMSSTPEVGRFKNLEVIVSPPPTAEAKEPSLSPSNEKRTEGSKTQAKTTKDQTEKKGSHHKRGKHERTNSFGRLTKRLEARPLRRSSISSVRRSDATVREKGRGYTFDDGFELHVEEEMPLKPLKLPSRGDEHIVEPEENRPATPSSVSKGFEQMLFDIDISQPTSKETRGKKEKAERDRVVDAVKKAASKPSAVNSKSKDKDNKKEKPAWRLGTLERRKRKERRAMYPPLSNLFNSDFNVLDLENQTKGGDGEVPSDGKRYLSLRVVDISLNDDEPPSTIPSSVSRPPKTSTTTTAAKRSSSSTSPPLSPTDPTGRTRTRQASTGSSVAVRAARLSNQMAKDNNLRVRDSDEREQNFRKGAVKSRANFYEFQQQDDEVFDSSEGSPDSRRRSLPRVPTGSEPYVSTKESTKIPKRKPIGKHRANADGIVRKIDLSESEKDKHVDAVDMGFVLVGKKDLPASPAQGRKLPLFVELKGTRTMKSASHGKQISRNELGF